VDPAAPPVGVRRLRHRGRGGWGPPSGGSKTYAGAGVARGGVRGAPVGHGREARRPQPHPRAVPLIKTVEDLYEVLAGSSPHLRFGIAFCESSGPGLVRRVGNDPELVELATRNALAIGAGHSFIVFLREGYPVNVLNQVKQVPEVCRVYCATANSVEVIVAETPQGRGIPRRRGRRLAARRRDRGRRGREEGPPAEDRLQALTEGGHPAPGRNGRDDRLLDGGSRRGHRARRPRAPRPAPAVRPPPRRPARLHRGRHARGDRLQPIALAIGIQNIPGGFAASAPLVGAGAHRRGAAAFAALTGAVEPPAAFAALAAFWDVDLRGD